MWEAEPVVVKMCRNCVMESRHSNEVMVLLRIISGGKEEQVVVGRLQTDIDRGWPYKGHTGDKSHRQKDAILVFWRRSRGEASQNGMSLFEPPFDTTLAFGQQQRMAAPRYNSHENSAPAWLATQASSLLVMPRRCQADRKRIPVRIAALVSARLGC